MRTAILFLLSKAALLLGRLWAAKGWVIDLICLIGKAVIIIYHAWILSPKECCDALFPMGTNYNDRIWLSKLRRQSDHEIDHRFVTGIPKDRQRSPTMAKINNLGFSLADFLIVHSNLSFLGPFASLFTRGSCKGRSIDGSSLRVYAASLWHL